MQMQPAGINIRNIQFPAALLYRADLVVCTHPIHAGAPPGEIAGQRPSTTRQRSKASRLNSDLDLPGAQTLPPEPLQRLAQSRHPNR